MKSLWRVFSLAVTPADLHSKSLILSVAFRTGCREGRLESDKTGNDWNNPGGEKWWERDWRWQLCRRCRVVGFRNWGSRLVGVSESWDVTRLREGEMSRMTPRVLPWEISRLESLTLNWRRLGRDKLERRSSLRFILNMLLSKCLSDSHVVTFNRQWDRRV